MSSIHPSSEDLVLPLALHSLGGASPWTDAKPFPYSGSARSFISGDPHSLALRVRYFEKKAAKVFAGRVWFGPDSAGPPGLAHGGSQAALLDEGMGAVVWLSGVQVLAAKLEINFRAPLPLGSTLTLRAEITKCEGRKIYVRGWLEDDSGKIYSEGTGLFIQIKAGTISG